jgi:hypothetical protein
MRVLVVQGGGGSMGAFQYITQGIMNALEFAGHVVQRWDGNVATWKEFEPDLYLGCSGHKQPIPGREIRKSTLVGIHVNPYSKTKVGIVDGGPNLDETPGDIEWTLAQKPNFVFCYCTDSFIPEYYGNWLKHVPKIIQMPGAADTTIFKPTRSMKQYLCDIGWVGGYWGYKAKMLDIYIKPLIHKYKCNIYGWGGWEKNQKLDDIEVPHLFASAKICPSVSEPHSRIYPIDLPERVFKIPAAGGFTIHSPSPAVPDLFGDVVPMAKDEHEWIEMINYYLANDDLRVREAARQRRVIISRHTYFDRCANMLRTMGFENEADHLIQMKWNTT